MNCFKYWVVVAISAALTACGGGGGSSGASTSSSSTGSSGTGTGSTSAPMLQMRVTNASDVVQAVPVSLNSGVSYFAQAVVKNADGTAAAGVIVSFVTDSSLATLGAATALTDAGGVARVTLAKASLSSAGAALISGSATVNGVAVSGDIAYSTAAANVSIASVSASAANITALQSAAINAAVTVNGVTAAAGAANVTFSATCGSVSPVSAVTNASGIAATTYQSNAACSGNVRISASNGSAITETVINVTAAAPANILYDGSSVSNMVVSSAPNGDKQSSVRFKVVAADGSVISNASVEISLDTQSISSGIRFFTGATLSTVTQTVTTNASGIASVIVQSGSLPTPVIVKGILVTNPVMSATSSGLVVTSGKASQNRVSISGSKLSIEAAGYDGVTSDITLRASDRQGNPIPAGTVVSFVASHGIIVEGTCVLPASSECTVTYRSQGDRPANGLATILAYLDGEESFTDLNGDNVWQLGEPFVDLGTAYRDDDRNGVYSPGEQSYPGGTVGGNACPVQAYPSIPSTCDGSWSGSVRVRKQLYIALASEEASITVLGTPTSSELTVNVADIQGRGMPSGSVVSATVISPAGTKCAIDSISPSLTRNSPDPGNHVVNLKQTEGPCSPGTVIQVKVTSSGTSGTQTSIQVTIP